MNIHEEALRRFEFEREYQGTNKPVNQLTPFVSVDVTTYQHKKFISQCLEGILMQRTTFPYEIIVGEDESIDGTREICYEYAKKYPEKIRLFLRDRSTSQYYDDQGHFICRFNGYWTRLASRGKYIAMCEGDDYWTDPLKLQKQVNFLELHPEVAICHHNMKVMYEDVPGETRLWNGPDQAPISTILDLAQGNFISTASCMYRNAVNSFSSIIIAVGEVGDYFLHMENARTGKIGYLKDVMGVYRVHQGGVWEKYDQIYKFEKLVEIYDVMKTKYSQEINEIIKETQNKICLDLINKLRGDNEKCRYYSIKILENRPGFISEMNDKHLITVGNLDQELRKIYQSFSYKLGHFILHPVKFLKRIIQRNLS